MGAEAIAPLCDEVQLAIVQGTATAGQRAHARSCPHCEFMTVLAPSLPAAAPFNHQGPLGAFDFVLQEMMKEGKPFLGRYRLLQRLREGGEGVVYRAHEEGAEEVALKFVRARVPLGSSAEALREQDVAFGRRVRHPGVCGVYLAERYGEVRVIVMELIEGENLNERLRQDPPLDRRVRRQLFAGICQAVQAIHDAGVVHLDLKPGNVVLRRGSEPVVIDFGYSASVKGSPDGRAQPFGGTPKYSPPEQLGRERVDRRADVYALGKLLEDLLPRGGFWIRRVIRRATAAEPEARHPDARALLRAVQLPRRALLSIPVVAFIAALWLAFFPPAPLLGAEQVLRTDFVASTAFEDRVRRLDARGRDELLLKAAKLVAHEYDQAIKKPRKLVPADFAHLEKLTAFLNAMDANNGHALYYEGEVGHRLGNAERRRDKFRRYLDLEKALPAAESGQNGEGGAVCYQRVHGYCRERTGWIEHCLAVDQLELARKAPPGERRRHYLNARDYAKSAIEHLGGAIDDRQNTRDLLSQAEAGLNAAP